MYFITVILGILLLIIISGISIFSIAYNMGYNIGHSNGYREYNRCIYEEEKNVILETYDLPNRSKDTVDKIKKDFNIII